MIVASTAIHRREWLNEFSQFVDTLYEQEPGAVAASDEEKADAAIETLRRSHSLTRHQTECLLIAWGAIRTVYQEQDAPQS